MEAVSGIQLIQALKPPPATDVPTPIGRPTTTSKEARVWMGLPPTGKPMRMRFSDFWLIKDGLFSENWVIVDHVDVLSQLGYDYESFVRAQAGKA